MRKMDKKIAAVALGAVALTGTGVAYAYWSTTGTGAGTASTSAGTPSLEISGTAGTVYPGSPAAVISGTVKNLADASGYVNTVSAVVKDTSSSDCDASNFSISGDAVKVEKDLVKGASATFTGQTLSFVNKTTPQDACKGVTVNLTFTSN